MSKGAWKIGKIGFLQSRNSIEIALKNLRQHPEMHWNLDPESDLSNKVYHEKLEMVYK